MTDEKFINLYKKNLIDPQIYSGALIKGIVTEINEKFVTINAFIKADGYIPISQFKNENGELEIKLNDEVEVVIDYLEDLSGDIKLSREKAKKIRAWEELERIHKSNDIIIGYITAKVKGGFTVKLDIIKAFLPGSLISFKSNIDDEEIKGKELKFKIIKLEKKKNNIVVSQKFITEEKNNKTMQTLLDKLNNCDIIKGIIKNITDYGVFIDLGGLDGLLHITDMSWRRVKHPSNLVKIGDEIKVKVLKFDKETNRVSLGLKQLTEDPWKNIIEKYKEGLTVNGIVTNITDYGCFVELEEGIEGLVHLSEMDWSNKNINPNKIVKQGMETKVYILDINIKKRRISLGIKQCSNNPWIVFSKNYKKGDQITGKIKSITDFGIFVELNGGIDALIHLNDISWDTSKEISIRNYKKGEEINTVILDIDIDRERISLGIKQLTIDPFLDYISKNEIGSVVECKIKKKIEKGLIVILNNNIEGLIIDIDKNNILKTQTIIKAKIIKIDRKNKNIILNIKTKPIKNKKDFKKQEYKSQKNEKNKPTLGDLLKKQI
ncbi:MAG TPA: 30S ribosomal protein S1 [Candidatus Azoamicus sp. MARI]